MEMYLAMDEKLHQSLLGYMRALQGLSETE
jgi:hypothetical protein